VRALLRPNCRLTRDYPETGFEEVSGIGTGQA
jgi:hypothetical protein